jgi:zinc D-Ala-D-Ala carboxypeptidase
MRNLGRHHFAQTQYRSSTRTLNVRVCTVIAGCLLGAQFVAPLSAHAYPFTRPLQRGDVGRDVVALEVRMAGWLPSQNQESLKINRRFSRRTEEAVKRFQSFYGLTADGIAGPDTYSVLAKKQDADGSTVHFNWGEFKQNRNPSCSAKANAYAGTFQGGMASRMRVKRYVRRLMWRLEALRAKAGGHLIGINSGFRSVDYNTCIGGAGLSQHMYGTAADQRMAHVSNHRERRLGEKTDFSGIGCYSQLTHNHFDIRVDNQDLRSSQFWWWPKQNSKGEDLDDQNRPCWGESASGSSKGPELNRSSADILTRSQVIAFMAHGEPAHLGAGD